MFERAISQQEVAAVLERGEMVEDYPDERPFPSRLLMGEVGGRTLHVVVARDPATARCSIVTVYRPDAAVWEPDGRTRRAR